MSDWRQDPELIRESDALDPDPELDERWRGVFEDLIPTVLGSRSGRGLMGQAVKLMVHQGRKYVSRNPDQARDTVIQAIRLVAAQLRIEPGEVYDVAEGT